MNKRHDILLLKERIYDGIVNCCLLLQSFLINVYVSYNIPLLYKEKNIILQNMKKKKNEDKLERRNETSGSGKLYSSALYLPPSFLSNFESPSSSSPLFSSSQSFLLFLHAIFL
jgi:hypothetical protein